MKINNTMMEYNEEITHFYLNNSKISPSIDWALRSQSLPSHLMRVPFSINNKKTWMGYGVDDFPKDY